MSSDNGITSLQDFGNCLKKIRLSKGVSQGNLSLKAGLQYHYVGVLERGQRNPTLKIMKKIAKALDIHISELLKDIDMNIID